jgi:hypothetical protein
MLRLTKTISINRFQVTHVEFKEVPEHFIVSLASGRVFTVPLFQCVATTVRLLGFPEHADQLEAGDE